MSLTYTKSETITLKGNPEFDEKWVQNIIANDPSILGLGDVVLKDKERIQPHAGRLDLLLQDINSEARYEVEIQLGKLDESHIIRTIEYWDIERKRYPQYDHYAVIIAEDITSRFLNVISLFNGSIPLLAIQMKALKFGSNITLNFTKVLDQMSLGLVDEDEEVSEVTDRAYWETRASKQTLAMVDQVLDLINTLSPDFELKYNKFYIGLAQNGQINNFVILRPKKDFVRFEIRIPKSEEMDEKLEASSLDMLEYDSKWRRYRIRLNKSDIETKKDIILELLGLAYGK
jgi:hypothetical protein